MYKSSSPAAATASVVAAKKNLKEFLRKLDTVPVEELQKSQKIIYNDAIAQVPYRSGKLEDSVYVHVIKNKGRPTLTAGANAWHHTGNRYYNYAGIQHEVKFKHPFKGKDHYISDPFNAEVARLKVRLRHLLKVVP